MPDTEPRYQANEPNVVYEVIDGEAVIVNMDNGSYYSVDDSGATVWELVAKGLTRTEVAAELLAKYEGSEELIGKAVADLVKSFLTEELIVPRSADVAPSPPVGNNVNMPSKPTFASPELKKYTDMEELLLLDPVYEKEEQSDSLSEAQ